MKRLIILITFLAIMYSKAVKTQDFMFKDWQKRWYYNPVTKKLEQKDPCEKIIYFNLPKDIYKKP